MSICQQFNLLCDKYPYITQGIVSGLLQVTGDVLVQKCINESERISAKRCYNFMLTGLVSGCIYRKWYGVLDNNFHDPRPAINAFGRAAADNLFGYRALGDMTTTIGSLQAGENFILSLGLHILMPPGWIIWTTLKFLNFYFMPLHYQVIVNTTLAVAYNLHFNMIKRRLIRASREAAIREGQLFEP